MRYCAHDFDPQGTITLAIGAITRPSRNGRYRAHPNASVETILKQLVSIENRFTFVESRPGFISFTIDDYVHPYSQKKKKCLEINAPAKFLGPMHQQPCLILQKINMFPSKRL
jgi:hypothetical protein